MVARRSTALRWSWAGLAVLGMLAPGAGTRADPPRSPLSEPPPEVINLSRATYKLKSATAEAVAALLKDNVKAVVLETKIDGDALVVTTTPDAQYAVGQFISLLQNRPLAPVPLIGSTGIGPGGSIPPPGGTFGPFGPGPGGSSGPFFPGPGSTGTFPGPGPGTTTRPSPPPGSTTAPPGPGH